jgi:tRNA-specific 2-thiouridylase
MLAVRFQAPQRAVTPGQTLVLYADDVVLGGGTIARRLDAVIEDAPPDRALAPVSQR